MSQIYHILSLFFRVIIFDIVKLNKIKLFNLIYEYFIQNCYCFIIKDGYKVDRYENLESI